MSATQQNLIFEAYKRSRRIRVTSLEAWREVQKSLPEREGAVMHALIRHFVDDRGMPLTSYELFRQMKSRDEAFDINSVRPRLTKLQEKGLVRMGEKVTCTITQKSAYTWELAEQVRRVIG